MKRLILILTTLSLVVLSQAQILLSPNSGVEFVDQAARDSAVANEARIEITENMLQDSLVIVAGDSALTGAGSYATQYDLSQSAGADAVAREQLSISYYDSIDIHEADHYVAPWGSDSNSGTFEEPWLTIHKACDNAVAGDTIYFRGGEYRPTDDSNWFANNRDGTFDNYIHLYNYPGEKPIFNHIDYVVDSDLNGLYLYECDYWKIRGLEIKNVGSQNDDYQCQGIKLYACTNIYVDQCVVHHNEGPGFYSLGTCDSIIITNSDWYYNIDINGSGGIADGIKFADITTYGLISGNRAWGNSDDNYDAYGADSLVIIENNWGWDAGKTGGDGVGFKLGASDTKTGVVRVVKNNISVYNRAGGIIGNEIDGLCAIYNNITYKNAEGGYGFAGTNPNIAHVAKNNISYDDDSYGGFGAAAIVENNSWNRTDITITDADFISLDTMELYKPRKSDGSLPDIDFLKPKSGSDLVDQGVPNDSIEWIGGLPDLGAIEGTTSNRLYIEPSDTAAVQNGVMYIDTDDNNVYIRVNGSWVQLNN